MPNDPIYINKVAGREVRFDNGGSIIKVAVDVNELSEHANKDGWVKVEIKERREPSDKGYTHFMVVDTYKKNSDEDEGLPF